MKEAPSAIFAENCTENLTSILYFTGNSNGLDRCRSVVIVSTAVCVSTLQSLYDHCSLCISSTSSLSASSNGSPVLPPATAGDESGLGLAWVSSAPGVPSLGEPSPGLEVPSVEGKGFFLRPPPPPPLAFCLTRKPPASTVLLHSQFDRLGNRPDMIPQQASGLTKRGVFRLTNKAV